MRQLTMEDIADLYDKARPGTSRPARTLRMETVQQWAELQTERFAYDDEGVLCLIEEEE